ncbi:hypothetical protein MMC13_003080, partial [Lambiella insularis]|nr:hypothetical protein [Lambiella insularis]
MTKELSFAPVNVPEASIASSTPTPTINTPLSEESTHLANPSSRRPSPLGLGIRGARLPVQGEGEAQDPGRQPEEAYQSDWEPGLVEDDTMGERPPFHRPTDGRSQQPLLKEERGRPSYDPPNGSARPTFSARRSTFRSRSPDFEAQTATSRKYTYAAFFLGLSLVSFVIQTETASYIQNELGWNKA